MTWTIAVRVQSEIYNNAHIQVAGQQLTVYGRSSYVGVLRMWAFFFSEPERENPCVDDPHLDNPRVANPHRENPAQRNTK